MKKLLVGNQMELSSFSSLSNTKLVLASASPRRKQLLGMLGLGFTVRAIEGVDESYPDSLPAMEVAEYIARKKCEVARSKAADDELMICADTVVVIDGQILGKPHSPHEACEMLSWLSGRTHHVVTGLALGNKSRMISESVFTAVHFARLTAQEIGFYVANFSPLDKAGAYGIQEWIGAIGVRGIDGSYYNVMGLPVHRLYQMLLNWRD